MKSSIVVAALIGLAAACPDHTRHKKRDEAAPPEFDYQFPQDWGQIEGEPSPKSEEGRLVSQTQRGPRGSQSRLRSQMGVVASAKNRLANPSLRRHAMSL